MEDRPYHTSTFTLPFQVEPPNAYQQLRKARPGTYGAMVCFLSRDTIVFALCNTFELELCKLILPVADATPILQTVSLLKLPSLLLGRQVDDIRLSQPAPLSGAHPPSRRSSNAAFPFRSNPEDDILAFDILFYPYRERRIIFVARRRTLLALAAEPHVSAGARAWKDWGPQSTHWIELDPLNDSLSLAGSRCVLVKYSHLRNHYVLDLRDFNPHRVRAMHIAQVSTVLSAEACFEEDVVCELPFVSLRKENVGRRVLLDDEWLAEIVVSTQSTLLCCCRACLLSVIASGTQTCNRSPSISIAYRHLHRRTRLHCANVKRLVKVDIWTKKEGRLCWVGRPPLHHVTYLHNTRT